MPGIINETIEQVPIGSLQPHPRNPRRGDVGAIQASIGHHGFYGTVVAQRSSGRILAGNHRWLAAKAAGLTEVPVAWVDVDDEQAERILLVDNRSNDLASYDDGALLDLLRELQATDDGLAGTGFDDAMDALLAESVGRPAATDDAPEPEDQAVSVPGDLWLLGQHRLLCGDSTSAADVARLVDGHRPALFATDPPYLVNYTGNDRPGDAGRDWSSLYHDVDIRDAAGFFRSVFANALQVCRDDAAWYCWHASKLTPLIMSTWEELGVLYHQTVIWVKPVATMTHSCYRWQHEPCLMGWKQGHKPPIINVMHSVTTVWTMDWDGKAHAGDLGHPTPKPVEVFATPMRKHTRPGEVCLELFSGSGSQIIAAEKTGRRCFAMELEPHFVDVAVRRWQEQTGQEATLDGDGRTFAEVAAERR